MRFHLIFTLILIFFSRTVFAADEFAMTTDAFLDAGALPTMYTCDGKDVSPQLAWTNPPAKTQSFAIIMSDPDAPSGMWYHWIVYNIPAATKELAEGVSQFPSGTIVGKNTGGKMGYNGPCPPKGALHTYSITLYALDTQLKLPKEVEAPAVFSAMKGHILKEVKLTTIYNRWIS